RGKLASEVLILCIVLFFVVTSFSYDPRAKLVPLLVGCSTLVLVLALLVNTFHPFSILEKIDVDWAKDLRLQELSPKEEKKTGTPRFLIVLCWIVGFFLSILSVGFHISIPLYAFAFLKIQAKVSLIKALLVAILTWAAVFAIFEWAMNFELFGGILFGEIIPPL
ncbi:MAG: tripartite tricarboxylate transporter TctB family protein, partial [Candidatus Aminicenantes bacterium]